MNCPAGFEDVRQLQHGLSTFTVKWHPTLGLRARDTEVPPLLQYTSWVVLKLRGKQCGGLCVPDEAAAVALKAARTVWQAKEKAAVGALLGRREATAASTAASTEQQHGTGQSTPAQASTAPPDPQPPPHVPDLQAFQRVRARPTSGRVGVRSGPLSEEDQEPRPLDKGKEFLQCLAAKQVCLRLARMVFDVADAEAQGCHLELSFAISGVASWDPLKFTSTHVDILTVTARQQPPWKAEDLLQCPCPSAAQGPSHSSSCPYWPLLQLATTTVLEELHEAQQPPGGQSASVFVADVPRDHVSWTTMLKEDVNVYVKDIGPTQSVAHSVCFMRGGGLHLHAGVVDVSGRLPAIETVRCTANAAKSFCSCSEKVMKYKKHKGKRRKQGQEDSNPRRMCSHRVAVEAAVRARHASSGAAPASGQHPQVVEPRAGAVYRCGDQWCVVEQVTTEASDEANFEHRALKMACLTQAVLTCELPRHAACGWGRKGRRP